MADGGQGTLGTTERMADHERLTTWAVRCQSRGRPTEPQTQCIPEGLLNCLRNVKPYFDRGMVVSQEDAPFSLDCSIAIALGRLGFKVLASFAMSDRLSLRHRALTCLCSSCTCLGERPHGRATSSLSTSLKEDFPVRAGKSRYLVASSNGWNRSSMSGIVRIKKVHSFISPWVRTA